MPGATCIHVFTRTGGLLQRTGVLQAVVSEVWTKCTSLMMHVVLAEFTVRSTAVCPLILVCKLICCQWIGL